MKWTKILTNESTLGTVALTIIGTIATVMGAYEIAGVAVGGIAGMLKGIKGDDDEKS